MKKLYTLLSVSVLLSLGATAAPVKVARHAAGANAPVVLPATDVTATSFTANWKPFAGADLYQVTCYEPIKVSKAGTHTILSESFDMVKLGTFQSPEAYADMYVDLDDLDMVSTPDWGASLPVFAAGMVSGIVYSPYIDLTNNDGKFTIHLGLCGYSGGMVRIESHGTDVQTKDVTLTTTGYNTFDLEFTNGVHDTFITVTDYGQVNDTEGLYADYYDFLDDITITQELQAGDTYLRLIEYFETEEGSGVTSHTFSDMKYLNSAPEVAYDVMAISVYYPDPEDPYDYDITYSPFSALERVSLRNGIADIDANAPADAPALWFNLGGVQVDDHSAPGIYIRRQGNTATKVVVK